MIELAKANARNRIAKATSDVGNVIDFCGHHPLQASIALQPDPVLDDSPGPRSTLLPKFPWCTERAAETPRSKCNWPDAWAAIGTGHADYVRTFLTYQASD